MRSSEPMGPAAGRFVLWSALLAAGAFPGAVRAQENGSDLEIRGNRPEINVTVKDNSGEAILTPATVKILRDGNDYDQRQTSKGHVYFMLRGMGEYSVLVEAPGYKPAQRDVSVRVASKFEVEVNLQRDTPANFTPGAAGGPILAPKAKEALDKGVQALRDDNLVEAQSALDQAMKLAPRSPDVLYAQGVLDLKRRDWSKAQGVLEKATQVDPNRARSFAALGMALCNQKKYGDAIPPLERALQLDATSGWETHLSLAQAYYYSERYDDALKAGQQAQLESNGQAPQADLLVAQALTALGRYEDAAGELRQMVKRHPEAPEAATAKRFLDRLTADGKIKKQ